VGKVPLSRAHDHCDTELLLAELKIPQEVGGRKLISAFFPPFSFLPEPPKQEAAGTGVRLPSNMKLHQHSRPFSKIAQFHIEPIHILLCTLNHH
jgi:hypothetical protein